MDDEAFDKALIGAAFAIAGRTGWSRVSVAEAAAEASLPLARARARFPARLAILLRLGLLADQAALTDISADGETRDRLFDMIMRRIDVLQAHRDGVIALLRYLPTDPPLALLLAQATQRSMRWMLDAVGVNARGFRGELATQGLVAVWLWTIRAWQTDESPDLTSTMAALDKALTRAAQAADWLDGRTRRPADEAPEVSPPTDPDLPAAPLDMPPEAPPAAPRPAPIASAGDVG